MPFYEYQCRACGTLTEVLQKVSDPPLRKCPKCGKNQLSKLISAPVFRLKGGGWYETDFKSDGENKRNLVGDKDEAPAKAEEAKPDAKEGAKETAKAETPAADKKSDSGAGDSAKKTSKPAAKPVSKPAAAKKRPVARPKKATPRGRR